MDYKAQIIVFLHSIPLFKKLSPEKIKRVERRAKIRYFKIGQFLPSTDKIIYIIKQGSIGKYLNHHCISILSNKSIIAFGDNIKYKCQSAQATLLQINIMLLFEAIPQIQFVINTQPFTPQMEKHQFIDVLKFNLAKLSQKPIQKRKPSFKIKKNTSQILGFRKKFYQKQNWLKKVTTPKLNNNSWMFKWKSIDIKYKDEMNSVKGNRTQKFIKQHYKSFIEYSSKSAFSKILKNIDIDKTQQFASTAYDGFLNKTFSRTHFQKFNAIKL